jgi:hypothetical protein
MYVYQDIYGALALSLKCALEQNGRDFQVTDCLLNQLVLRTLASGAKKYLFENVFCAKLIFLKKALNF